MKKVVINRCFGGYGLSLEAIAMLKTLGVEDANRYSFSGDGRDDERLLKVIETLGEKADTAYSNLQIVEIPDDVQDWYIDEYDGNESIKEGRTWI